MLPENRQIYLPLFLRTLIISVSVTAMCLLLGYPLAYWLSVLPMRIGNLLMIMVLAAVLDIAAGSDHGLDRVAANPGHNK